MEEYGKIIKSFDDIEPPNVYRAIMTSSNDSINLNVTEDMETDEVKLLDCPEYSNETAEILNDFAFWTEGVVLCGIGLPGILGNALSSYILAGKSMRNSFNLLLIALAVIDNTYLFGAILESIRKRFGIATQLQLILFPYFLYPLHMMAMTGSILMTVAIALERYNAVHWPISYSQTMNDSHALKIRVLKYLIPVTIISISFNITKFFEIYLKWNPVYADKIDTAMMNITTLDDDNNTASTTRIITDYNVELDVTEFRTNPIYSINFNWFRFISIGIIPFLLLVYFNTQIYIDIRKQRRRKKARARKLQTAATTTHIAVNELQDQENLADTESTMLNKVTNGTAVKTFNQWKQWLTKKSLKHQGNESGNGIQLENRNGDGGDHATALVHTQDPGPRRAILRTTVNNEQPELQVDGKGCCSIEDETTKNDATEAQQASNSTDGTKCMGCSINGHQAAKTKETTSSESSKDIQGSPCSSCGDSCSKCPDCCSYNAENKNNPEAIITSTTENHQLSTCNDIKVEVPATVTTAQTVTTSTMTSTKSNGAQTTTVRISQQNSVKTNKTIIKTSKEEQRGRTENSLAAIMMGYVLVFLICHSPRLLLNLHELTTIRNAMDCRELGKRSFAAWSMIMMHISHLLLVINSSINILIYCCLSSKFREEGFTVLKNMFSYFTCGKCCSSINANGTTESLNPHVRGRTTTIHTQL